MQVKHFFMSPGVQLNHIHLSRYVCICMLPMIYILHNVFYTENILENDSKSKPSNDEEETTETKTADVTLGNGDDKDVTLGNGDDTDVTLGNSDTDVTLGNSDSDVTLDNSDTDVTLDNSDTDAVETAVTTANFVNDCDTDSVTTLVESGADEVQRLQGEPNCSRTMSEMYKPYFSNVPSSSASLCGFDGSCESHPSSPVLRFLH